MTTTMFVWVSAPILLTVEAEAQWQCKRRDLGMQASGYGDCRSGGDGQGAVSFYIPTRPLSLGL